MPLYAALIVTAVARLTRFVEAGKEALLAPAGTITVAGTETMEELPLDSVAALLPDGAGPLSLTVPVEICPPATLGGASVSPVSVGGGVGAGVVVSMRNSTPS